MRPEESLSLRSTRQRKAIAMGLGMDYSDKDDQEKRGGRGGKEERSHVNWDALGTRKRERETEQQRKRGERAREEREERREECEVSGDSS